MASIEIVSPRYPDVTVQLTDQDGNIFALIGVVRRTLRSHGVPTEKLDEFGTAVMARASYDEALQEIMRWVNVE